MSGRLCGAILSDRDEQRRMAFQPQAVSADRGRLPGRNREVWHEVFNSK